MYGSALNGPRQKQSLGPGIAFSEAQASKLRSNNKKIDAIKRMKKS